jgi:hypothetical protein
MLSRQTRPSWAVGPRLAARPREKIQFQLLLADFSLEFVNSPLRLGRIGEVGRRWQPLDHRRDARRWAANTAQRFDTTSLKSVAPMIQ